MHSDKKNSLWLFSQYTFAIIVSFVTIKINLSHFGESLFGTWLLMTSIWGIGSSIDLGFGTALVKNVAEYNNSDKTKLSEIISSSFFIFVIIGIVLIIGGLILGKFFVIENPQLVNKSQISVFIYVFIILSMTFYINFLGIFLRSIFEGFSNFVTTSKITMIHNTVILCGVIIISFFRLSIVWLAALYLTSAVNTLILYSVLFVKNYSFIKIRRASFNYGYIKKVWGFGLSVQLVTIFSALMDPAIKYTIGNFYNISFVSIYEVGRRFAIAISNLFFATFRTILPKVSVLKSSAELKEFFSVTGLKYLKMGIAYSGLTFGVGGIIIAVILKLWFGSVLFVVVFLILGLPEAINNFGYTSYMTLLGIGKANVLALVQFLNLVITVTALFIIFKFFNSPLGLLGYFVSVSIANILILLMIKKYSSLSLTAFFKMVGLYKLVYLIVLLLSSIILIFFNVIDFYVPLAVSALVSYYIFRRDFQEYSRYIINALKKSNLLGSYYK